MKKTLFFSFILMPFSSDAWELPAFLQTDESKAQTLYKQALNLSAQAQTEQAQLYYQRILKRYPDSDTAHIVRIKLEDLQAAQIQAEIAAADIAKKAAQEIAAAKAAAKARQDIKAADALYQKALGYEDKFDFDNAKRCYQYLQDSYPKTQAASAALQRLSNIPSLVERYLAYPDGTAKDLKTGLIWMRCAFGQTWDGYTCSGLAQALEWETAAHTLQQDFANKKDWRLPSIEALRSLVYCSNAIPSAFFSGKHELSGCDGRNYAQATIMQTVFPQTPANEFWSATPSAGKIWSVSFAGGYDKIQASGSSFYVRLVRGERLK